MDWICFRFLTRGLTAFFECTRQQTTRGVIEVGSSARRRIRFNGRKTQNKKIDGAYSSYYKQQNNKMMSPNLTSN